MAILYVCAFSLICILASLYHFRGITLQNIIGRSEYVLEEFADKNESRIHEIAFIIRDPNDDRDDAQAMIIPRADLEAWFLKRLIIFFNLYLPILFSLFYLFRPENMGSVGALFISATTSFLLSMFSIGPYHISHGTRSNERNLSLFIFGPKQSDNISAIMLEAAEFEIAKCEEDNVDKMPENTEEEKATKRKAQMRKIIRRSRPKNINVRE